MKDSNHIIFIAQKRDKREDEFYIFRNTLLRWGIHPRGGLGSMGLGHTPVRLKMISTLQG
jgi:hypothetical protein